MKLGSNFSSFWPSGAATERIGPHISEEFKDVASVELSRIDGVPSVEIAEDSIVSPAQAIRYGQRLQAVVGNDFPVFFFQLRGLSVTFLLTNDELDDDLPERVRELGDNLEDVATAWGVKMYP